MTSGKRSTSYGMFGNLQTERQRNSSLQLLSYKGDGAQLFSAVPGDISRGSDNELQVQEIQVELEGKRNHSRKVVQHRGMAETPLLNVLKIQ